MATTKGTAVKNKGWESKTDFETEAAGYNRQPERWRGENKSWVEKIAPVLMVVVIVMSFALGSLWSKVKYLENGITNTGTTTTTTTDTTTAAGQPQAANKASLATIKGLFDKDVIKFGDAKRKVLFVEFADPSCPFCHVAAGKNPELNRQMDQQTNRFKLTTDGGAYLAPEPEMRKLVDSGKAGMVIIYTPGHGNGEMGMKALYCANEQGKFWQAHDKLYTMAGYELLNNTVKNDKTKSGEVTSFLTGVVDTNKLKSCLDSGKYDSRISADVQLAGATGSEGTPGFYINDKFFNGAYSYDDMAATVNSFLK
jgi:protein-disulfide isomerase